MNQLFCILPNSAEVELPTAEQIADRTAALLIVAASAEGVPPEELEKVLSATRFPKSVFSPRELRFISTPVEDRLEEERWHLDMMFECVPVFLWALQVWDDLPPMSRFVSVTEELDEAFPMFVEGDRSLFSLRPTAEILDFADYMFCMMWAVHEFQARPYLFPDDVKPEIVAYRDRALRWLVFQEPWDEVSQNT